MSIRIYFAGFILSILFTSCYKEGVIDNRLPVFDYQNNIFSFTLLPELKEEVLNSRNVAVILDPVPELTYGGYPFRVKHMKTRGQSALNFQRKSYSVHLNDEIIFSTKNGNTKAFNQFKLISMVFDYTYIENQLAHLLMSVAGLWPLHSFYTEVALNNDHQGLYLFIEDPVRYLFEYENADHIIRRYYHNEYTVSKSRDGQIVEGQNYIKHFKEIYNIITLFQGKTLYDELLGRMNIDRYMRKMAFDFIVQNGDYTDEIFFYGCKKNEQVYFDILPWDYDDLFESTPHEVGRDWAVGRVFGSRKYNTHQQVLDKLDGKLIFSIEDDLDYCIAMDDYLYRIYVENLKYVLSKITTNQVAQAFELVHQELLPFYQIPEVIEQSNFDANATSLNKLNENIENKLLFLTDRINWINQQLNQ